MPINPLNACSTRGCKNKCKGSICDSCRKRQHRNYNKLRNDKELNKAYSKKSWQVARKSALFRDEGLCQICKEKNAILVDHIVEIKDGGLMLDVSNLQSLCHRCHAIKTQRAETFRMSGGKWSIMDNNRLKKEFS